MARSISLTVKFCALLVLIAAAMLFWSGLDQTEAGGAPGSLFGRVTDADQVAIADTVIEVIDGTHTVVASDTTDGHGDYAIPSVAEAPYPVKATPPVETGFA